MSSSDSRKSKKKRHSSSKASLSNASDDALPTATPSSSSLTTTTAATTTSIQVKVVASNPLQDPIVCSFPGGVPSSCTPQHSQNGLTFQWFKKKKKHASHPSENDDVEYVLKGQDDACEYYGSCTASSSSSSSSSSSTAESSHTKLCVGIYDKQTNVVTFYPTAGNGAVISLQQFVPSYHQAKEQSNDNDMESNGASQQQRSSNALLYADFGSAKKRRVLQSQEANRVTVEAVVGDTTTSNNNNHHTAFQNPAMSASNRSAIQHQQQMNMAMAALSTSTSTGGTNSTGTATTTTTTTSSITLAAELATSQWRQTFLPPYDTMATRASQIYNVETIAGSMVWNTVLPNLLRTIRRSINTDNGPVAIAIIPYLNRHRTNLPSTTAHRPIDDMIYGTDIVSDLLNAAAAASKLPATSDETWSPFFQSTILLNYFICLYNKFHQQKFRMPALISKVDDDDDDDDMEGDETDPVSSFRYRQYGSTPKMILQRFLELFTSTISTSGGGGGSSSLNTKCVMSRPQQQKCLVHIFVLYIMSFSLMNSRKSKNDDDTSIVIHDITPLLNELQMSDQINAAVLLLREAGCIVTRVRSTVTQQPKKIKVELSVPLTFPKMKKKQRA